MKDPETYWEKRCIINENALDAITELLAETQPPYIQEEITRVRDSWDKSLEAIEAE